MKWLPPLVAAVILLTGPASVLAQDGTTPRALMKGDVSGTVAWVLTDRSDVTDYNDWRSQAGFGLGAGWYWTDHHLTRFEVSGTTRETLYSPVPFIVAGNQTAYIPTRRQLSTQRLGIVQLYQFRRNEWVHPFIGAGVDVVWDRIATDEDPVYVFDPLTRQPRVTRPAVSYGERTTVTARGVLTGGVKAYVARKAFTLTDLRVSLGSGGARDVQWRFGMGFDF
jgi:hypothetical protein